MFTPITPAQYQTILSLLKANPADGVSFPGLMAAFNPAPEERELRRWLATLADRDCLYSKRDSRGTRYYPTAQTLTSPHPAADDSRATADSAPRAATGASVAPAAPALTAAPASKPDFHELFGDCVDNIVICGMSRASATGYLQARAKSTYAEIGDRREFVSYGRDRLDCLTAEDAEDYGILPEQYTRWHKLYFKSPAGVEEYPPPPPRSPLPAADEPRTAASLPSAATLSAGTPVAPPPSNPMTASASEQTSPSPTRAPDLLEPLANIRIDHVLTRAFDVTKALLTPTRIATTLGWAIALRLANDRFFWLSDFSFLAMFALAGVPWLAFRIRDAITAKTRLNAKEALILFLAGAYLSLLAARLTLGLLTTLRYSIR